MNTQIELGPRRYVCNERIKLGRAHVKVLWIFSGDVTRKIHSDDLARELNEKGCVSAIWRGFDRVMNELRRSGHVSKKMRHYSLTPKGKAFVRETWTRTLGR
jgi:Mn-dependent DtxR family transcriptional regulator